MSIRNAILAITLLSFSLTTAAVQITKIDENVSSYIVVKDTIVYSKNHLVFFNTKTGQKREFTCGNEIPHRGSSLEGLSQNGEWALTYDGYGGPMSYRGINLKTGTCHYLELDGHVSDIKVHGFRGQSSTLVYSVDEGLKRHFLTFDLNKFKSEKLFTADWGTSVFLSPNLETMAVTATGRSKISFYNLAKGKWTKFTLKEHLPLFSANFVSDEVLAFATVSNISSHHNGTEITAFTVRASTGRILKRVTSHGPYIQYLSFMKLTPDLRFGYMQRPSHPYWETKWKVVNFNKETYGGLSGVQLHYVQRSNGSSGLIYVQDPQPKYVLKFYDFDEHAVTTILADVKILSPHPQRFPMLVLSKDSSKLAVNNWDEEKKKSVIMAGSTNDLQMTPWFDLPEEPDRMDFVGNEQMVVLKRFELFWVH